MKSFGRMDVVLIRATRTGRAFFRAGNSTAASVASNVRRKVSANAPIANFSPLSSV